MCDNAFEWARQKGRLRTNEIHGAEEADLPFLEKWEKTKESGSKVSFTSGFTMEDPQL